jgi:hypothetical protein
LGLGLAVNSLRGLASREGMYDEASTSQMRIASWLGLLLGLGLGAAGAWTLFGSFSAFFR